MHIAIFYAELINDTHKEKMFDICHYDAQLDNLTKVLTVVVT